MTHSSKEPTKPSSINPSNEHPKLRPHAEDMVCVTLQRPPHFWRFACAPDQTADLLERLAEIADCPDTPLTWNDAELIASEIVIHHQGDSPSADQMNDR